MVRCTRCGGENEEGAQYCTQCGASLYPSAARSEKYEKAEREMCFGPSQPPGYFWLIVGLIIIFWGVSELLKVYTRIRLEVWPMILIAIGLYIIYRVLSRSRRT